MNKKELLALLEPYSDEDEVYLKLWKGRYGCNISINAVGKESANFAYWYTDDFQDRKIRKREDKCIFISADVPESD